MNRRQITRDSIRIAELSHFSTDLEVSYIPIIFNQLHAEVPAVVKLVNHPTEGIAWDHRSQGTRPLTPACFPAFLNLVESTGEQIANFVRTWGVLGIWPKYVRLGNHNWSFEPFDLYRHLSGKVHLILRCAARLHRGQPVSPEILLHTIGRETDSEVGVIPNTLSEQRPLIAQEVTRWLTCTRLRSEFQWEGDEPRLNASLTVDYSTEQGIRQGGLEMVVGGEFYPPLSFFPDGEQQPSPLFSFISIQLAAALTSPYGLYICDLCGTPFNPASRRRRSNVRAFCSAQCAADGHLEVAQRSYQRRKAKTQSLKSSTR